MRKATWQRGDKGTAPADTTRFSFVASSIRRFVVSPSAFVLLTSLFATVVAGGCVRRTLTISTEPPHALVYLNDQEIGRSTVTTDFLWYGDYDVILRKEGFETLKTHWDVRPPWYQIMPFDFLAEVVWPGHLHDQHARHFVLEPAKPPERAELIERAQEARRQAFDPRKWR